MQHGDNWKLIADELNLKSKHEAILEFLRIPVDSDFNDPITSKSLLQLTQKPPGATSKYTKDFRDVEPYNQADQLFLQCELLQQFAQQEDRRQKDSKKSNNEEKVLRKRLAKEKRKLAQKIMIQELALMEEELKELKTVDNTLSKIRHDYKNLMSQMFAERVSMTISNKRLSQ